MHHEHSLTTLAAAVGSTGTLTAGYLAFISTASAQVCVAAIGVLASVAIPVITLVLNSRNVHKRVKDLEIENGVLKLLLERSHNGNSADH